MKNKLQQVDKLEVVVLVDNYSDEMIADTPVAKRLRAPSPYAVMAEPGLSFLIKVYNGGNSHTILMDGGISGICLTHNISLLSKSFAVKNQRYRQGTCDLGWFSPAGYSFIGHPTNTWGNKRNCTGVYYSDALHRLGDYSTFRVTDARVIYS